MSTYPFKAFKGNGNGNSGKPTEIKADGIPIIGQPFQVKGGLPIVNLQCACEGRDAVMLVGAAPGQCPSCKRAFVIAQFAFNAQTGQIQVNIGLVQTQPQPAPEPEPIGSVS